MVLKRWWGYSAGLLVVVLLLNWFIFGIAGAAPDWVSGVMGVHEGGRGKNLYFVFAGIGPLINLGIWVALTHFTIESIDDVSFHDDVTGSLQRRKLIVWMSGMLWGAILLPLVLWPYTFYMVELWGEERRFWFMPGYFLGSLTGVLISGVSLFFVNTKAFDRVSERIIDAPAKWGGRDET